VVPDTDLDALLARADAWVAEDPDPHTADQLRELMAKVSAGDAAALHELNDAFAGTLEFGTAGLRGRLGPGSNRMNRVVVMRAAAGLASYVRANGGDSIVIGYDARHNSNVFAHDTARVMRGAGVSAMVLPRPLPTPVLAFAIRHLGAAAGVMVTASHNPAQDNGYKVYLGDGRQIVSPTDRDIAARISQVGALSLIPLGDDFVTLDDSVLAAYIERAVSLLPPGPRDVTAVSTAMHGVGGDVLCRVVIEAGFPAPVTVAAQQQPDPLFPTVTFPNPEEPGAIDLALAQARITRPDIVIANDPDADRCAAAVPHQGDWRMLTGDEIGWLLGWWTIQRQRRLGQEPHGALAQSIVSGAMLQAIASDAGIDYAATLTGFKWVSRVPDLIFGYEEALGYCVDPSVVSDKDGITAALVLLELAAHMKSQGRTLQDVLDDLARLHGVYLTSQVSVRVTDLALIGDAMSRLRAHPPTSLAGLHVLRFDDLEEGSEDLPATDGLRFVLDGARVIVRPSGTEPKLKCYLQVVMSVTDDLVSSRDEAAQIMHRLRADISRALNLS
jgi:phosphomannomutase